MRLILLTILQLLTVSLVYSQELSGPHCHFLTDTLTINYGQTFSNKLAMVNDSKEEYLLVKEPSNMAVGLIVLPDTIKIEPGAKKVFPLKYMASSKLIHHPIQAFTIRYKVVQGRGGVLDATFYTRLQEPERVSLTPLEPVVYQDPQTSLTPIRVHCVNTGYTEISLKILTQIYPEGLEFTERSQLLELKPGASQIILLNARNMMQVKDFKAPDFTINVIAENITGTILATTTLRVVSLKSYKRLQIGNNLYNDQLNNTAEINYIYQNQGDSYLRGRANGRFFPSGNSKLEYNLNGNYYNQSGGFDVYDTWARFSNRKFSFKIGNIYENTEFPLYGRGLEASAFIDKENSVSLFYINNSYLLFSTLDQAENKNANVVAGIYNFRRSDQLNGKMTLVHGYDPLFKTSTNLAAGELQISLTGKQSLNIQAGYSVENSSETGKSMPGYGGGIIYTNHEGNWRINLNNYVSSSYYSGLRRGVLQLNNQVSYQATKATSFSVHYNQQHNTPKFLASALEDQYVSNDMQQYEIGVNTRIRDLTLSLRPYYLHQYQGQYFIGGQELRSSSLRMMLELWYTLHGKTLSLSVDYGFTKSNNLLAYGGHYNTIRINANFRANHWGLNAHIQKGPYYLQEEPVESEQSDFKVYSFGPSAGFDMFRQKLNISISNYLNYNGYIGHWNNLLNAQLKYKAGNTWQISAQIFYNVFTQKDSFSNFQGQIGIQKHFIDANAPGLKRLELTFFGDHNANGVKDANENTIPDVIVDVSGEITKSNKHGKVNYTNLTKGEKVITIQDGKGWHLLQPQHFFLNNHTKMIIALVKSGQLRGRLVPVEQKYLTEKPVLEGIRINAIDQDQKLISTLTDEEGRFHFSLPLKKYTIYIETAGHTFLVDPVRQDVTISEGKVEELIFHFENKERKVEIKKFK